MRLDLDEVSFGNAAGVVKTLEDVRTACRSAMTEITVGSITVLPRTGNEADPGLGRTYYYHPSEKWSLNALGLPNIGLAEYSRTLPEMVRMAHGAGKDLRVSVAGFTPKEYALLTEECMAANVDEVEVNLGCPNSWGEDGKQKPIASYHPDLTASILQAIKERVSAQRRVAVKISPVGDKELLLQVLEKIKASGIVSRIVGVNTIPNQERKAEDGSPALSFNNGNHVGGLAGSAIAERSLDVMSDVIGFFGGLMEITSVGGIATGEDVMGRLELGATGIQCATAYVETGPRLFSDLFTELAEFV